MVGRRTPEVTVKEEFVKRLMGEYRYPEGCIQYAPKEREYRVGTSPSGGETYPVDIAVFRSPRRLEMELSIVVETKPRTRQDGERQLKILLQNSAAEVGAWYNGEEHLYVRKVISGTGIDFVALPDLPAYGERMEDLGKFRRGDLVQPTDLKAIFRELRNHLAGNVPGITRDQELADQIISVIFCKLYDEKNTPPSRNVEFRAGSELPRDVGDRVRRLFERVKAEFGEIFDPSDSVEFDDASIAYICGALQRYSLMDAPRDAVGEAFEVFVGPALRGEEGQFFTPRNVVEMAVRLLRPTTADMIIDPACGSGGFLVEALKALWLQVEEEGKVKGWTGETVALRRREIATRCLRGIDKDRFLAKVARAYMAILGDGREMIFCENSLLSPSEWSAKTRSSVGLNQFSIVVTNPPHGSKVKARGISVTGQYRLGRKWRKDRRTAEWSEASVSEAAAVPVLFVERCRQLLRPGGRLAIVFPETYLGMPSYGYVSKWILDNLKVDAVVSMPEDLFQPYTHNKVCVIVARNEAASDGDKIAMGIVRRCGHDSRGRPIPFDDVPEVADLIESAMRAGRVDAAQVDKAFTVQRAQIKDSILVPKYYDPRLEQRRLELQRDFDFVELGELIRRRILSVGTGVEVGKLAYGTGPVPFVRTSDLVSWEIRIDPKQSVSRELYEAHRARAGLRPGDILLVRDGTYLVGNTAMVTQHDPEEMLLQAEILRFRVQKSQEMSPYLLLALLNSKFVQQQIRARQFTRGVIDTLGDRYKELLLPVPREKDRRRQLEAETEKIILERAKLKAKLSSLVAF